MREWLEEREAKLLPAPYFHVVYTLPGPIADIAYQNKAVIAPTPCDTAATPNLIPMPAAHAPLNRSPRQIAVRPLFLHLENRRSHSSNPHRRETEPLPARDFVPWRFSDACRGSGWMVL